MQPALTEHDPHHQQHQHQLSLQIGPGQAQGQPPSSDQQFLYDPHSPQSTGSPEPPPGILTDAEVKLWELAMAIHSVQTRFNRPMTTGTTTSTSMSMSNGTNGMNGTGSGPTAGSGAGGGGGPAHQQLLLAEPVQEILQKMLEVDEIAAHVPTMLPRQAIEDLDNTHHPGHVLKERIEAVALENAFLNGKIEALTTFRAMLGDALAENFPELASLRSTTTTAATATTATTSTSVPVALTAQDAVPIKQEEP